MPYYISLFDNSSNTNNVSISKPGVQQDSYFIAKGGSKKPGQNVLIAKGSWKSYDQAFPHANFLCMGPFACCFWDAGNDQIATAAEQDPTKTQVVYKGTTGTLVLTVSSNGTIAFTRV